MQIINVTIELREEFTLVKKRKYPLRWYIIINNVAIHNNTIEIPQTVNGGYDFHTLAWKVSWLKMKIYPIRILQVADYKTLFFRTVICIKRILISP